MDFVTPRTPATFSSLTSRSAIEAGSPDDRFVREGLIQVHAKLDISLFDDEVFNVTGIDLERCYAHYKGSPIQRIWNKKRIRSNSKTYLGVAVRSDETGLELHEKSNVATPPVENCSVILLISESLLDYRDPNLSFLEARIVFRLRNGCKFRLTIRIPAPEDYSEVQIVTKTIARFKSVASALLIAGTYILAHATFLDESSKVHNQVSLEATILFAVFAGVTGYLCFPKLEGLSAASKWASYAKYPEFYFDAVVVGILRNTIFIVVAAALFAITVFFTFSFTKEPIVDALPKSRSWEIIKISETEDSVGKCLSRSVAETSEPVSSIKKVASILQFIDLPRKKMPEFTHIYRRDVTDHCLAISPLDGTNPVCVGVFSQNADGVGVNYLKFEDSKGQRTYKEFLSGDYPVKPISDLVQNYKELGDVELAFNLMMSGSSPEWRYEFQDPDTCSLEGSFPVTVAREQEITDEFVQHIKKHIRTVSNLIEPISGKLPTPKTDTKANKVVPVADVISTVRGQFDKLLANLSLEPFPEFKPTWQIAGLTKVVKHKVREPYLSEFYGEWNNRGEPQKADQYFLRGLHTVPARKIVGRYYNKLAIYLSAFHLSSSALDLGGLQVVDIRSYYKEMFTRINARRKWIHCSSVDDPNGKLSAKDMCAALRLVRAEAIATLLAVEKTSGSRSVSHDIIVNNLLLARTSDNDEESLASVSLEEVLQNVYGHDLTNYLILAASAGLLTDTRMDFFREKANLRANQEQRFYRCYLNAVMKYAQEDSSRRRVLGISSDYVLPSADTYPKECSSYSST